VTAQALTKAFLPDCAAALTGIVALDDVFL
jgi:hypothetical protein